MPRESVRVKSPDAEPPDAGLLETEPLEAVDGAVCPVGIEGAEVAAPINFRIAARVSGPKNPEAGIPSNDWNFESATAVFPPK